MTKKCFWVTLLLALWLPLAGWSDYRDDWGPVVGSVLPRLEANDHTGALRNLENLAGEGGLLLLLNRSADW
ncbi:MAG: hypothetical protein ACE1ZA_05980 [Pseudomonadales bacterium]